MALQMQSSPCAACKFLRRKCTKECVFAPYFPHDQYQQFANLHNVFGASNVAKLLNDLIPSQRQSAVNSLVYEAEARIRDPVYGCVGLISLLQQQAKQVQYQLYEGKKELSTYIGPSAMLPIGHPLYPIQIHQYGSSTMVPEFGMEPSPKTPSMIREQQLQNLLQKQQKEMLEAQQLAMGLEFSAKEQKEKMEAYKNHQQELVLFNSRFDGASGSRHGFNQFQIQQQEQGSDVGTVSVYERRMTTMTCYEKPCQLDLLGANGIEFNQIGSHSQLALVRFDNQFQDQQQEQEHPQHHQRTGSDMGESGIEFNQMDSHSQLPFVPFDNLFQAQQQEQEHYEQWFNSVFDGASGSEHGFDLFQVRQQEQEHPQHHQRMVSDEVKGGEFNQMVRTRHWSIDDLLQAQQQEQEHLHQKTRSDVGPSS